MGEHGGGDRCADGAAPALPGTVARPPRADILLMAVGIARRLDVGTVDGGRRGARTGRGDVAQPAWRVLAIWPVALVTRRSELAGMLAPRAASGPSSPGCSWRVHFATWVAEPALHVGGVGDGHRLHPTDLGRADRPGARSRRAPSRAWLGHRRRLVGVVVLTGVDFSLDAAGARRRPARAAGRHLRGALHGGGCRGAAHGEHDDVHRRSATATAAVLLLVGLPRRRGADPGLHAGRPGCSCSPSPLGAQLLGHSVCQRRAAHDQRDRGVPRAAARDRPAPRSSRPSTLGQMPPLAALPAALLLLVGLGIVISSAGEGVEASVPTE